MDGYRYDPNARADFQQNIAYQRAIQGELAKTLMAMIRANTRLPIDTVGDVYSLMACNDVGCRRLVEMMDEFGLDDLDDLRQRRLTAGIGLATIFAGVPHERTHAGGIQRKLEEARWSGARLETRFLQVSEAGEIANIGAASQVDCG